MTPLTPYEQMTGKVETETASDATTWDMFDVRWDRVCYLTRELLGIPHEKPFSFHNRTPSKRSPSIRQMEAV